MQIKLHHLLLKLAIFLTVSLLALPRVHSGDRPASVLVVSSSSLSVATALSSTGIEGNIDDIARAVLTYFPKVLGKVLSVNGEEIELDLGGKPGLSRGTLLSVYREEEVFRHPVTDVPLGRFEDEIGILEIIRSESNHFLAHRIGPPSVIQAGDLVRITAARIPLAVSLLSSKGHPFLMNEFVSALSDTGRFKIESLTPGVEHDAARLSGSHYHISLGTSRVDDRFLMKLEIQNVYSGTVLADLSVLIKQSEESDLILEHLQFQLFERRLKK